MMDHWHRFDNRNNGSGHHRLNNGHDGHHGRRFDYGEDWSHHWCYFDHWDDGDDRRYHRGCN